jgi:inorganic pyrophosphatase
MIYPLDYGHIPNATLADGYGIDVFVGTSVAKRIVGLICTFDGVKRDSEIKVVQACTEGEIQAAMTMVTRHPMRALLVRREE